MSNQKLALVLSGGGARGAYEAGVLHHIRKKIMPDRHGFQIHCGTSAGSINTCYLASAAHNPRVQADEIRVVWEKLRSKDIYRGDLAALGQFLLRSTGYTLSHFFGIAGWLRKLTGNPAPFHGVLDTSPFIPFLKRIIPFDRIHKNIHEGPVDAVVVATTNIGNGHLELFIDKKDSIAYTGDYTIRTGKIHWSHAMASAAVPIIFPPVRVGNQHYVDGAMRQNTPMSPAVQLGANKILIIGVKYKPVVEVKENKLPTGPIAFPTLTHMLGKMLDALFLDHIDYDLEQMTRINRIIEWGEETYGAQFLDDVNQMLIKKSIRGDIADRGLKKIEAKGIFPTEDIGKIALDRLMSMSRSKKELSQIERFFLKFLEIDPNADLDLLSYLMFDKEFVGQLIDMGIRDATAREDEIAAFIGA